MPPQKERARGTKDAGAASRSAGVVLRGDGPPALVLAAIVGLVFRGGLGSGLVADDFSLINYCRFQGLGSILGAFDPWRDTWYYRPVTKLVFGLAYALFGTAPAGYHVLSLAAHAAAVVLLFLVARRAGASTGPAFAGALLFAVHFRQHESVFWFSAISYPLSTAFGLAAALWFRSSLAGRRPWHLAAALASAAAAMLTKDTAAVLPVLAGLYGLLFAGGAFAASDLRRRLLRLLPLGVVLLVGTALQAVPVEGRPFARGGAGFSPKTAAESLAFLERAAALVVPGLDASDGAPPRAIALAALAALVAYVAVRRSRLAVFGLAWVAVALAPFYVFVPRMGDLYLYLPLAGVALVAVDAAELLAASGRSVARGAAALFLAAFAVWSAARIEAQALRWRAAGEIVNGVVAEVKASRPALARGATLVLEGLPEDVGGVYAFRNAAPAAFWLAFDDRTLTVLRPAPGESDRKSVV